MKLPTGDVITGASFQHLSSQMSSLVVHIDSGQSHGYCNL